MSLFKPYLAIIIDSFHSALASRVLWAAMLAIWLLLGSLAPIGLREDYTTKFRWFDIYNGTRMKALLAQGIVDPEVQDKAIGRLAAAMPDEMKRKLQRVGEGDEVRIRLDLLTDALNELVESDASRDEGEEGWYEPEAWKTTVRLRELRELDETSDDELATSLRQRRSRLRIEAALPGVFEARSARSVLLTYAGLDFPTEFQIDRSQFETIFNQFVIPILVNWLLGLVLVFLGVLVTASIVPDMLQTGSLHLLLSKPVSRWALIVSKFVGGCAFVLLCVTQLVIGLYLIAALRLGVWNARILWCIPVALLIFAVFYSVSVLAGLKWRSAIISIAAAGALAAICVVVGIIGGVIDARIVQPDRIASMTMAGDDLFAVTGGSGLVRLDLLGDTETTAPIESTTPAGRWEPIIDSEAMTNDRILSPVSLDADHLLTARIRNGRFNPFGSGSLDLIVLPRQEDWKPQPTLRLPTATERLMLLNDDQVLAINTADLLLTTRDKIMESLGSADQAEPSDAKDANLDEANPSDEPGPKGETPLASRAAARQPAAKSVGSWLRALVTMQGGATEDFTSILPSVMTLSPPARVVPLPSEKAIVVLTGDRVFRLEAPEASQAAATDQRWQVTARTEIDRSDESAGPVIAASNRYVLIAHGDQALRILDATSLTQQGTWDDPARQSLIEGTPIQIVAISDHRFLYRTTSGHVDLIEVVGESPSDTSVDVLSRIDLDNIESISWHASIGPAADDSSDLGMLNIAHDVDRISRFQIAEDAKVRLIQSISPPRSVWRRIDYYGIGALEWLTPQVLQLGDTTAAMVSGNQSMVIGGGDWGDQEVVRYRITRPLVSCFLFIFVVMSIACWYFGRTDF
ncbi:ABC transporter permease [Neorhodopirellula pilleata]|uniref:ABC-2 family transporter protein n=1 Tax=Neorhodopirellula pilleata TaxID=2714738 RepID=A0A5C6AXJ1_9BACT|nr:ABC transporter permease [Neorhodopirellula pilleata]TWU03786.1 ABC-2 family transporter protein [Neorhodopirellula pilleata]